MKDDVELVGGQVPILDRTGKRALNQDKPGKRSRPPGDYMQGFATRAEVAKYLGEASVAVGQKVFDQLVGENQEQLDRMEDIVTRRVIEYFESRTFRGRVKRAVRALFPRRLHIVEERELEDAPLANPVEFTAEEEDIDVAEEGHAEAKDE